MILGGRPVVFLASIEWDAPWQRHQAWACAFAEAGNKVFFVENTGFRRLRPADAGRLIGKLRRLAGAAPGTPVPKGLRVISPGLLPPCGALGRKLNRRFFIPRLVRKLEAAGMGADPIVMAYLPTRATLDLLDALRPGLTVYDCVDNFSGHPEPPEDLAATETELLRRAGAVFATSRFLFEKCRSWNPRVFELHHGVSEEFLNAAPAPAAYRRFCYFGTLWSAIDYGPIAALAEAGFEVALIGQVKEKPPPLPGNVRFLGLAPARELPGLIAGFDGLLLPYADTAYNRGVLPSKTFECLASGKPVLAGPIPELKRFSELFYLAGAARDWVEIARRLPETETEEKRKARVALAREHSTRAQFGKMTKILEGVLARKAP